MKVSLDTSAHHLRMYWYVIRHSISYPSYPFVAHANGRFSTAHPQFETLLHDPYVDSLCLQLGYADAPETIAPVELHYRLIRPSPDKIQYVEIPNNHQLPSITTIGVHELFSSNTPSDKNSPVAWFVGNKTGLKHSLEPVTTDHLRLKVELYKAFNGETVAGKYIMHRTPMENWRV